MMPVSFRTHGLYVSHKADIMAREAMVMVGVRRAMLSAGILCIYILV